MLLVLISVSCGGILNVACMNHTSPLVVPLNVVRLLAMTTCRWCTVAPCCGYADAINVNRGDRSCLLVGLIKFRGAIYH